MHSDVPVDGYLEKWLSYQASVIFTVRPLSSGFSRHADGYVRNRHQQYSKQRNHVQHELYTACCTDTCSMYNVGIHLVVCADILMASSYSMIYTVETYIVFVAALCYPPVASYFYFLLQMSVFLDSAGPCQSFQYKIGSDGSNVLIWSTSE